MSKEVKNTELSTDKALHIADVGSSIFVNVPVVAFEKVRLTLSKEDLEKLKHIPFTSEIAYFIWNKLPNDKRPDLDFFMEWFYGDIQF